MSYTNATFYMDLVSGSDAARTALTSVTVANNGSGLVRCTKTAHGLVTGAVVDVTLNYAGAWIITKIDANNFDLVGSTYSTSTSVTVTPRGGSSKADAWLTFASGATSARHAAGDTIRIKSSPDPTSLGQNATWTAGSKTVTLTTSVTQMVSDCETAWTASANVTATAVATGKENSKYANIAIAGAFTTGLCAFFATGTLDLSGYQQLSFWIQPSAAVAASTLSLRLCTDTAGVTSVHTFAIPAINLSGAWMPVTVDLGGAMNSAIKSVAVYQDSDIAAVTLQLDNIIACKASSSADSLTLTSLIGKVWNLNWVASTTYASNDIRKPTPPNRNGYRFKVTAGGGGNSGSSEPAWTNEIGTTVTDGALTWTCEGVEDTWYAIQSINGTTIKLDTINSTAANAGQGYGGATETVTLYKRETIKQAMVGGFGILNAVQRQGIIGSPITYSGGWNTTDMTTQTGETWADAQHGANFVPIWSVNGDWNLVFDNLNATRGYKGHDTLGSLSGIIVKNCHANNCSTGMNPTGVTTGAGASSLVGVSACNCTNGLTIGNQQLNLRAVRATGCTSANINAGSAISAMGNWIDILSNNSAGVGISASNPTMKITGLLSSANVTCGVQSFSNGGLLLINSSVTDTTPYQVGVQTGSYVYSQKDGQVANAHLITTDMGTIISATDQRHTASGISWKFRPTSTNCVAGYELKLSVAKIACAANTLVTLSIWTYRDHANVQGSLVVRGGQIAGVPNDVVVACNPTINTWVQSANLTFTPTEAGVVEVLFLAWDGVTTTHNSWIDDFSQT